MKKRIFKCFEENKTQSQIIEEIGNGISKHIIAKYRNEYDALKRAESGNHSENESKSKSANENVNVNANNDKENSGEEDSIPNLQDLENTLITTSFEARRVSMLLYKYNKAYEEYDYRTLLDTEGAEYE